EFRQVRALSQDGGRAVTCQGDGSVCVCRSSLSVARDLHGGHRREVTEQRAPVAVVAPVRCNFICRRNTASRSRHAPEITLQTSCGSSASTVWARETRRDIAVFLQGRSRGA